MTSSTITIERRGADATPLDSQTPETVGADRSPVEHAPQGLRRVVGGLWQSLRQAPAYY